MTSPFVAQTQESLTPIRYYTDKDPYFYTVDNRPLQDIEANLVKISGQGADSARRASLIAQLNVANALRSLFSTASPVGFVDGLEVSLIGDSLQIGPGSLYSLSATNTDIGTPIVKQALNPSVMSFTLTDPTVGLGNAKDYLVQVKAQDVTAAVMDTSRIPFLDATNTLLDCLLLNKELVIQIKEGATANLGSQVTPTVDAGFIPLYVVTYTGTLSSTTVRLHSSGPDARRGKLSTALSAPATLAGTGSTTLTVPVTLSGANFNPYLPVKVKMLYSVDAPNNAAVVRLNYVALGQGTSVSAASTDTATDTVAMPATADVLYEMTTSAAQVPNTALSGFVSNKWAINKLQLKLTLERLGSDVADTTDGVITVYEVQAYQ